MEKEKYLNLRREYYSKTYALLELIKCLKHKELSLITAKGEEKYFAVRYLVAKTIEYWNKHNERFKIVESNVNLYCSVASLKNIPIFSYNPQLRRKEDEYKEFNEKYAEYIESYDLFLDFDSHKGEKSCNENCAVVKELFDEYQLPYFISNSSLTGFHIIVPSDYMPNIAIEELLSMINLIISNLIKVYMLETLDSGIIDPKRLRKLQYSVVGDGSICLPLEDIQFDFFKPEMVLIENVLKNIQIKERGLLVRKHNLTDEQLKKNVIKFINEWAV